MRKFLCAFGDNAIKKSFKRFAQQANALDVYDEVCLWSTEDLDEDFKRKFKKRLIPYTRGFGFWVWKPQIILQTLRLMNDGDLLQYTDIGCHLNPHGKKRLLDYFDIVSKSKFGILAFRAQVTPYNLNIQELYYPEYEWTKGDLFDYFGVRNNKKYTHTMQFGSGIIFIRKNQETVRFFEEFLNVYLTDFDLASDKASVSDNLDGFIAHREDQSIFSLLCKKYNVEELSSAEYYATDWDILKEYPIHAKRDKEFKNKLTKRFRHYLARLYKLKAKFL